MSRYDGEHLLGAGHLTAEGEGRVSSVLEFTKGSGLLFTSTVVERGRSTAPVLASSPDLLVFDRYGDFEGFLLDTEDGDRRYTTRERDLAELAERAWRERLRITVCTEHHTPHRPETITVLPPPVSFHD